MKKYIVKDDTGTLHVIGANGFVPDGVICEAPDDADPDDGNIISIVNGVAVMDLDAKVVKVQAILDQKASDEKTMLITQEQVAALLTPSRPLWKRLLDLS